MKKTQRAYHAVIEICMIRILNEDSPSINTPGDRLKGGRQKEKKKRAKDFKFLATQIEFLPLWNPLWSLEKSEFPLSSP